MKYTIQWSEKKSTSTGKEKIDATLSDGTNTIDKVTIWDSFPNFANLMSGHEVEGDIVTKQNGQYTNKTLYPVKVATTPKFGGSGAMSKMMDKKAENIKEAQERKAESIAYFNSVNSAIALVNGLGTEGMGEAELKVKIRVWRDWFLSEYETWNAKTPF
jgi:hypothetical protein